MTPLSINKKKILILGSAGFIGKNLVEYFLKKSEYEVYIHYRKNLFNDLFSCNVNELNLCYADLTNASEVSRLFEEKRPNIVLQYAAYTTNSKDVVNEPYLHATTNYIINSLVLEAAHKVEVEHFIYPSCSTMYESSEFPLQERDWNINRIPKYYQHVAYMKVAVERMMQAYADLGKCKYTVVRQSNVYGPYDKTDLNKCHMFMAMVNKIVDAKDSIEVWGNPENEAKRDLVYIDDVVKMVDLVIEKQKSPFEIFNCGFGQAHSVSQIIKEICSVINKKIDLIYDKTKPSIPTTTILDCSKALNYLGWKPQTPLKEGIKKTLEWYII